MGDGWAAGGWPPTLRRETGMTIERIIPEIRSSDLDATRDFYCGLLGLVVGMEQDPFLMLNSTANPSAQLTVNDNGHPGLPPGFAVDVGTPRAGTGAPRGGAAAGPANRRTARRQAVGDPAVLGPRPQRRASDDHQPPRRVRDGPVTRRRVRCGGDRLANHAANQSMGPRPSAPCTRLSCPATPRTLPHPGKKQPG